MRNILIVCTVLASVSLGAGCSVLVDSKLKDSTPPDEDGGMVVTDCTRDMDCVDGNPCNGVETCDTATSRCVSSAPAPNGTPCPRAMREGVCLAGACVACVRDEDCNNGFACDGAETCRIDNNTCQSGILPAMGSACMTTTVVAGGTCRSSTQCCDVTNCCTADDTCELAL